MGPKNGKKSCAKYKLGTCTAKNCPFPHIDDARNAQIQSAKGKTASTTQDADRESSKLRAIRRGIEHDRQERIQRIAAEQMEQASFSAGSEIIFECRTCKVTFTMEADEIKWYKEKDYFLPKNCRECRASARNVKNFEYWYTKI